MLSSARIIVTARGDDGMISHRPSLFPKAFVIAAAWTLLATAMALADAGDLDAGFGTGGTFDVDPKPTADRVTEGVAVALQEDGKIVVAGSQLVRTPNGGTGLDAAVWRLEADGTLDRFFGEGGVAVLALPENQQANAVAIQR